MPWKTSFISNKETVIKRVHCPITPVMIYFIIIHLPTLWLKNQWLLYLIFKFGENDLHDLTQCSSLSCTQPCLLIWRLNQDKTVCVSFLTGWYYCTHRSCPGHNCTTLGMKEWFHFKSGHRSHLTSVFLILNETCRNWMLQL